jgi:hypothetical protein
VIFIVPSPQLSNSICNLSYNDSERYLSRFLEAPLNVKLTAQACRAARGLLDWTVRDLMREAQLSPNTAAILERGGTIRPDTEAKITAAFARHGVQIIGGAGTTGAWMRLSGAPFELKD